MAEFRELHKCWTNIRLIIRAVRRSHGKLQKRCTCRSSCYKWKLRTVPWSRGKVQSTCQLENPKVPSNIMSHNTKIIAADLVEWQVEALVLVLRRYKKAICWTITDILDIHPG
ncbi:hypothetical protein HAX54_006239, partial [Datura stramonium]|nr:hypothetical protein [Datura stramonium]